MVHILGCGVVAKHAFRAFATQSQHEQIAHAGQQILHETTRIESADHDLLYYPV